MRVPPIAIGAGYMTPLKIINVNHMKKLIILDLDNTLIYASLYELPAKILFKYSDYLTIYARPHTKEFVQKCRTIADVVVVTTAVRDYAKKVCEHLQIKPIELFSREDCLILNYKYVKSVPDYYFDLYDDIIIFDDSPELWDKKSHEKCRVIGVAPFTGEADDDELDKIKILDL